MSDYDGFSSYSDATVEAPVSDGEKAHKKSKRNSIVDHDMSAIEPQQFAAEITDTDVDNNRKYIAATAAREVRKLLLDVLAFAAATISNNPLSMDTIIALVDRFDIDGATDQIIKNAVRAQVRAGMIERVGRSYQLSAMAKVDPEEMRGAFKGSFRR